MIIAIVLVQRSLIVHYSSQTAVEARVNAINGFYDDLVEDAGRAMYIVSKRAAASAISYVVSKGVGLSAANETMVELILNGTINGTEQPLMNASTIVDWEKSMESIGLLEGFQTDITVGNITVLPFDSYDLKVSFLLSANLSDKNFNINLTRSRIVAITVEIFQLEDPLYALYTYGRAVNFFVKTPHWLNYSSEDLTNLQDDLNNSYYHPSKDGASFLDRLEGKCTVQDKYRVNATIGLESFVDKDKLAGSDAPFYPERSSIDYIYFCGIGVPAYQIDGMPTSFRMDNQTTVLGKTHLEIYNVSERVVS